MKRPDWITPKPIRVHREYKEPSEAELRQNPNVLEVVLEDASELLPICDYLYYLDQRLGAETVRYIVFVDAPNRFVALLPVTSISMAPELIERNGNCKAYELVDWIHEKDFTKLGGLTGFVARDDAASMDWSKAHCLRQMLDKNLEALPVVRDTRLIGVVEKIRLVTSILADVLSKIDN